MVFQPSEENGDGAQAMVDDGLVDKAPELYADAAGRNAIADDVPVNHSSTFAPVLQPTLDTAVSALAVAALAWLSTDADGPS